MWWQAKYWYVLCFLMSKYFVLWILFLIRGTGVSGLTRGLVTLPQWSETGMEDPQEDPLAMHCFCMCSGSVLLGDLLGVRRCRWWWQLTTRAINRAKLESNHHHQQTNIQFFYRPDALPVAQPTVSKHWREMPDYCYLYLNIVLLMARNIL